MKQILMTISAVALFLLACARQNNYTVSGDLSCFVGVMVEDIADIDSVCLVNKANIPQMSAIKDGKFFFEPDSMQMYKILLDYHYRLGVQPLIVVGEPGNIKVTIDSVSHAIGTPQNDSLDKWKFRTEMHNRELLKMRKYIAELRTKGDSAQAKYIEQRADSFHLVYKNYTRQMAKNLKDGVLHDFLDKMFPLTYKRTFPDGRVVTMNADTHEEISE